MSSLTFHDLPRGPLPLFAGEPVPGLEEAKATLLLDHHHCEVRFVAADPFTPFTIPPAGVDRYSWWDVDPTLPRWQVRELYGEARPLLERIQMGTTLTQLPTHWHRTRTPEALAAAEMVEELAAQPAQAAVEWVPGLRPVREETALERAIRIAEAAVRSESIHQFHQKELAGMPIEAHERNFRNMLVHGKDIFYPHGDRTLGMSGSPILSAAPGSGKSYGLIGLLNNMGPVSKSLATDDGSAVGSPSQETMRRRTKGVILPGNHDRYSRKGINGKWGALFEESDVRRVAR